jgi:hypothetical protein
LRIASAAALRPVFGSEIIGEVSFSRLTLMRAAAGGDSPVAVLRLRKSK